MLVFGATGRLGRPIVKLLLARGHRVRAGVRDPDSEAASDLARLGADVVVADFDVPETIVAATRAAGAVVAAGTAHRVGPDGERRHGLALADALSEARTDHLVYVSGAGADRPTGVPVFESKRAVEQRIAEVGLTATILAPVYFMENAFNPWNLPGLARGRFPLPRRSPGGASNWPRTPSPAPRPRCACRASPGARTRSSACRSTRSRRRCGCSSSGSTRWASTASRSAAARSSNGPQASAGPARVRRR